MHADQLERGPGCTATIIGTGIKCLGVEEDVEVQTQGKEGITVDPGVRNRKSTLTP